MCLLRKGRVDAAADDRATHITESRPVVALHDATQRFLWEIVVYTSLPLFIVPAGGGGLTLATRRATDTVAYSLLAYHRSAITHFKSARETQQYVVDVVRGHRIEDAIGRSSGFKVPQKARWRQVG